MEVIKELFIKSLGLFNSNQKHFATMKNTFYKLIIIVLTFQIINKMYNVTLDFSFELMLKNLFDKIGIVSLGIYLFLFGFFQGLINIVLPDFFIKRKTLLSEKMIESKIKYLIDNNPTAKKLIDSKPSLRKKISAMIIEPYVFLFLIGCCFGLNLISLILIITSLVFMFSAGNIITICCNLSEKVKE